MINKNKELLDDFVAYCNANPNMRFWQCLRNWSGQNFILTAVFDSFNKNHYVGIQDTYYWETKDGQTKSTP